MDQQDKNWLELGRQLKNYQPEGNPDADFLDFKQLQRREDRRRFVSGWWLLPFLLLLLSGGLYWRATSSTTIIAGVAVTPRGSAHKTSVLPDNPTAEQDLPASPGSTARKAAPGHPGSGAGKAKEATAGLLSRSAKSVDRARPATQVNTRTAAPVPGAGDVVLATHPRTETVEGSPVSVGYQAREIRTDLLPEKIVPSLSPAGKLSAEVEVAEAIPVNSAENNNLRFTLNAGISDHWRGENFLQDADYGLYASIGLYRSLGRRFALEGQLGYRGHNVQLPGLRDAKQPWSYHKDEIHNTGHLGEQRVYIYEGIVEGYRAVEFSLLVRYQLDRKIGLHAGGRYALPAIKFQRVVHGPDEENPFHDFIEGQEIVKYNDYGAIMGVNYRLTNHLSLQGEVHLGLVDLIENAAQEGDRFNRSNSLSVGVRYLID